MASVMKHVIRVGVIGALLVGAGVVVAGPHRVRALFHQARENINCKIDRNITDPVALRSQLRDLASQYPKRIGEVRADLGELREQIGQLQYEKATAEGVVELTAADINKLNNALAQAEQHAFVTVTADSGAAATPKQVVICFKSDRLSVEDAYGRVNEITNTHNAFAAQADDLDRDLGYLGQQESRLVELLGKLETEQQTFETQLWELDRKVDAVARNDRMIDIMEKRQRTIDEQSRYRAGSLEQITARLSEIKTKQEAKLAALNTTQKRENYEAAAKAQIDRDAFKAHKVKMIERKARPEVIEIRPDDSKQPTPAPKEGEKKETLASRG
jgi:predicted nuclease with TOPRIM domain